MRKNVDYLDQAAIYAYERRRNWRRLIWVMIAGVLALLISALVGFAHAQTPQRAVLCNTEAQLRELMAADDSKAQADIVNARDGEGSCGFATFIYDDVEKLGQAESQNKLWVVVKLHIIAVATPDGVAAIDDYQFTAFLVPSEAI